MKKPLILHAVVLFAILTLGARLSARAEVLLELPEWYGLDESSTLETLNSDFKPYPVPENKTPFLSKPEDYSRASVVAVINKSAVGSVAQTMQVYINGQLTYTWKVSTGREMMEKRKNGKVGPTTTPVGYFRPTFITRLHKSQTWLADMPYAVFFNGGIATHATSAVDQLGKRASGGCIRLSLENAKIFFNLVKNAGVKSVPTINRNGATQLNQAGQSVMSKRYDVLIIVENRI